MQLNLFVTVENIVNSYARIHIHEFKLEYLFEYMDCIEDYLMEIMNSWTACSIPPQPYNLNPTNVNHTHSR